MFRNWKKDVTLFIGALALYSLLSYLFAYVTYIPEFCESYYVGSFGASGRLQCSLVDAWDFIFTPFYIFDEQNATNLLAGVGLTIWFIATILYFILFAVFYKLILFLAKSSKR